MKNVLSASRLHLEILNLKSKSTDSLLEEYKQTILRNKEEYYTSSKTHLLSVQKYIPLWKVERRHLISPFSSFFENKEKIEKIEEIDITMPNAKFKDTIIKIFQCMAIEKTLKITRRCRKASTSMRSMMTQTVAILLNKSIFNFLLLRISLL